MKKRIAIIGGGASGMMAAIQAAKKGADVCIYEKNDRIGKKILATGNGKCNFSNLFLNKDCYRSGDIDKVMKVLSRFNEQRCVEFFKERGMLIKDRDGYLYPASEQASTVLDILSMQLAFSDVNVISECEIFDIKYDIKKDSPYVLTGSCRGERKTYNADAVIVSCGGLAGTPLKRLKGKNAYDMLGNLNLPIIDVVPALVQLRCKEEFMKEVAGVRVEGDVTLYIDGCEKCREHGEIQLTDYGVSGIPVFQLSRYAAYGLKQKGKVQVILNVMPNLSDEELKQFINNRKILHNEQTAEEYFLGICNKKLLLLYMKLAGIKPTDKAVNIPMEKLKMVFDLMRHLTLNVTDTNSFDQAQVCAGGLSMDAVDDSMQVKDFPWMYVIGELLDVDGRCGGYNLQWAFASGYVAGNSAAEG